MITRQNLHMHSTYDDGHDSCREMLLACRQAGLLSAGVSLHSPMPFPADWTCGPEMVPVFRREMQTLKAEFGSDFRVLTGIEWDVLSDPNLLTDFDYVIGSVHHLPVAEIPPSVDNEPAETENAIRRFFGGDADAAAECYFGELLKVAAEPRIQICGHFDLLLKFNEHSPMFDPESTRYLKSARKAMDALLDAGKVIEVNTGAISRGWRTSPYPQEYWLRYIARRGGKVLISSDAHRNAHVTVHFSETETLLKACGFDYVVELGPNGSFEHVPLMG